jgi:hypothetical protein
MRRSDHNSHRLGRRRLALRRSPRGNVATTSVAESNEASSSRSAV